MKGNAMWYVKLNDTIIPTPHQYFSDCLAECKRLQQTMVAVCTEPVFIN
nr:MAG TPA: hypothetical protein [Caudoviricetes sp.]